jgi:hypothetical protein
MNDRLKPCHCGIGKRFKRCHGKPSVSSQQTRKGTKMKIGKDSVVMGNVPEDMEVGEGCVIIGATDDRGNCIINTPMAVGRDAHAGPGSIAIGAGAGAGSSFNLVAALQHLSEIAKETDDSELLAELAKIITECSKPAPNKSIINRAWETIKAAASLSGASSLVSQISIAFASL